MCVPSILSALAVKTWFQSIRTLFGWLKKKTSGQGAKPLTARQKTGPRRIQFPVGPPVHLGRPQPAWQGADPSTPGGSGGRG